MLRNRGLGAVPEVRVTPAPSTGCWPVDPAPLTHLVAEEWRQVVGFASGNYVGGLGSRVRPRPGVDGSRGVSVPWVVRSAQP